MPERPGAARADLFKWGGTRPHDRQRHPIIDESLVRGFTIRPRPYEAADRDKWS